jgi:hypothetical protein
MKGLKLERFLNSRSDCIYSAHLTVQWSKLPNLELKTQP